MPVTIQRNKQVEYPIKRTALIQGRIYEGSDNRIYVGCGTNLQAFNDMKLLAVEINGRCFVTDISVEAVDEISFRELDVTLTIHN